jgi:hypothetical protein
MAQLDRGHDSFGFGRLENVKSKHHINRGSPCIAGAKTRALSAAMR